MSNEIKDLKQLNTNNKKDIHKKMCVILENICFFYLKPLSDYIYTSTHNGDKYTSFCDGIFLTINDCVTKCFKAKDENEFQECWTKIINYAKEIHRYTITKLELENNIEKPKLEVELEEENSYIYNRFFKRKRKKRNGRKTNVKTR